MAPTLLVFAIQKQLDNWCWVAVASSIDAHFNHVSNRTQCDLAGSVLLRLNAITAGVKCCPTPPTAIPDTCRQAGPTDEALKEVGRFHSTVQDHISFAPSGGNPAPPSIKTEIANNRPIGCAVGGGTDAHALVIYGWETTAAGQNLVHLRDPNGPHERTIPYDVFISNADPSFQWTRTYLTQPGTAVPPVAPPPLPPTGLPQLDAFRSRVSALFAGERAALVAAGDAAESGPMGQHKMYVATVQDALNKKVLSNAKEICSRRFVFAEEGGPTPASGMPIGSAKFTDSKGVLAFSSGPSIDSSFKAFQDASMRADVKNRDCEPRYLKIVGLSLVALWLHYAQKNESYGNDCVLPLEPTTVIPTGEWLSAGQFAAACQRAAALRGTLQP